MNEPPADTAPSPLSPDERGAVYSLIRQLLPQDPEAALGLIDKHRQEFDQTSQRLGLMMMEGLALLGLRRLAEATAVFHAVQVAIDEPETRPGGTATANSTTVSAQNSSVEDEQEETATPRAELAQAKALRQGLFEVAMQNLRAPIANINGFATLIAQSVDDNAPFKGWAEEVRGTSSQMLSMIHKVLAISTLQTNQSRLRSVAVPMITIVEQAISLNQAQASRKGLRIQRSRLALGWCLGDPEYLRDVVDNLIGNAVQNSPMGGTVVITLGEAGEKLELSISDEGPGLSIEQQTGIFEHFHRNVPQDGGFVGTGPQEMQLSLGLSLCRQIVELHQGEIGVSSTLGQGARFWVRLPRIAAPY
jgi:signal transduction histidine kinase